ncbi:MAG TPA: glycoside hydrolase family 47 protein [Candidatus Polarisedimenticolia bacterium]|jgi:mannosidase alpha-like ER degradation enhancer 2|nr:glycoside hydrolase family 47 protein [Candidatus Polarisedimenticolia bacterium]
MLKRFYIVAFICIVSATSVAAFAQTPKPSSPGPMALQVRSEFLYAWNAYKQYAWGHDELRPLSKGHHDWYSKSLLMTPVDALDTMIVMGLTDEADKTREFIVQNLSFDQDIEVKNFEITIRLLGGLLSSYQMTGDKGLLDLADNLGNRLLPVFNSPTGMPYMFVNLKTGKTRGAESNPAEIGTLLLEFGTLSKLSGKPIYYDKAKRAVVELYNRRSKIGLVGSSINVATGKWIDTTSHISGGIDSYYEYLLKSWLLFEDKDCRKMWEASVKAVNKYLADNTRNGLWYGQADMNTGKRISTQYGALDAFFPAVLARSGDLERARRLQESSYKMWTTFGIEPETLDYTTMKATAPGYQLRPEIIESAYYLAFFTKDQRYQEMGSTFLLSLVRYSKTDAGFAALSDVETKSKKDSMESYFLAETLKYLYLLFAPRETLDLNKVVFNTEAHPLRKTW